MGILSSGEIKSQVSPPPAPQQQAREYSNPPAEETIPATMSMDHNVETQEDPKIHEEWVGVHQVCDRGKEPPHYICRHGYGYGRKLGYDVVVFYMRHTKRDFVCIR